MVPDKGKSLREGAIEPWSGTPRQLLRSNCWRRSAIIYGIDRDHALRPIARRAEQLLLYGPHGADPFRYRAISAACGRPPSVMKAWSQSDAAVPGDQFRSCRENDRILHDGEALSACRGARLRRESLRGTWAGKNIDYVTRLSVRGGLALFRRLEADREGGSHRPADAEGDQRPPRLSGQRGTGLPHP